MKNLKIIGFMFVLTLFCGVQAKADHVLARFQPKCLESLRKTTGNTCELLALPEIMGDRYGLINVLSKCHTASDHHEGSRRRQIQIRTTEKCWVILTRKKPRIIDEMKLNRRYEALTVFDWNGRPAVLARDQNKLVLITSENGRPVIRYQWACPKSRCFRRHQVIVQKGGLFPDEPMQVLVVGRTDFLVKTYTLFPPHKGGKIGKIQLSDRFIPVSKWKEALKKETQLEKTYRSLFPMNLWQKLKDKVMGVDPAKEVERAAQSQMANLVEGVRVFLPAKDTLILTTQKPLTLTMVDLNARYFRIAKMSDFGEHMRPISSVSTFFVENIQEAGSSFWLFVDGFMVETKEQFLLSHPNAKCPYSETLPDHTGVCVYSVGMIVRWKPDTEETRWWFLYDQAKDPDKGEFFMNALNIENYAIEYVEADSRGKTIKVKRKSF